MQELPASDRVSGIQISCSNDTEYDFQPRESHEYSEFVDSDSTSVLAPQISPIHISPTLSDVGELTTPWWTRTNRHSNVNTPKYAEEIRESVPSQATFDNYNEPDRPLTMNAVDSGAENSEASYSEVCSLALIIIYSDSTEFVVLIRWMVKPPFIIITICFQSWIKAMAQTKRSCILT
jgi:hypothetical protein